MYKTIIFDLDDTLNDDTKNVKEAFKIIMNTDYTEEKFEIFREIDKNLWRDRAAGIIKDPREGMSKDEKTEWIRAQRFIRYFKNISYEEAVDTVCERKVLQEIMGHKTIAITMQVYNHVLEGRAEAEMQRVSSALVV